jgi:hypothetical protein
LGFGRCGTWFGSLGRGDPENERQGVGDAAEGSDHKSGRQDQKNPKVDVKLSEYEEIGGAAKKPIRTEKPSSNVQGL